MATAGEQTVPPKLIARYDDIIKNWEKIMS